MGGVDVRGGAPGTRETDLLRPGNLVERVHGVVLSGGSAFGLDATAGVVRYLEEHGIGVKLGPAIIPIVPAAILYDLNLISHLVRPGPEAGYRAALASSAGAVAEGSVGAGTGATVGKAMGLTRAVKGGIGTSSVELPGGITVGAMVAVNAYGSVVDHRTGEVIAGPRREDGAGFHDTVELLTKEDGQARKEASPVNTTIGVVATNAALTREQAHFLARLSHDGLALTIRPCHTLQDGDTIFALATAKGPAPAGLPDLIGLGTAAVEVVATSVLRALLTADGLGGVPSVRELGHG
jgi:L-aminopeptidase/D-esterase-like protein